jgi:hypothetical protein
MDLAAAAAAKGGGCVELKFIAMFVSMHRHFIAMLSATALPL